jgi:hypothetical protein
MRRALTMFMSSGWRCEPWAAKALDGRDVHLTISFGREGLDCLKTGERPGCPRLSATPFSSCHSRRSTLWESAVFLVGAVLPLSGFRRGLVSDATYSILRWSLHGVGLVLLRWVFRFRFVCHGYSLLFTAYPKAYAR